ncbi:MAG: hypothetical protein H6813_02880 [Phycisphaeraceae bacterium]|nr:hypothetical protein [Phycisphaeraceae bacterium]MCB9848739.1 hypothetical protein [Phycisphaeraceae bacterium]
MANHHFGEIGDVWKHLPLLEVASIEAPRAYWESHSGSAAYTWVDSEARRFGASRFLEVAGSGSELGGTAYAEALRASMEQGTPVYPGSPRLMLGALSESNARFVFCDIDGASLASIEMESERLGVPGDRVACVGSDGNRALLELCGAIGDDGVRGALAMLDPFSLEAVGEGGVSSLDALHALSHAGARVLLWWCATTPDERDSRLMLIERAIECGPEVSACTHLMTVGDDKDSRAAARRFGVWACAVTLVNMSGASRRKVAALGAALARGYSGRGGDDGLPGLRFVVLEHASRGAAL